MSYVTSVASLKQLNNDSDTGLISKPRNAVLNNSAKTTEDNT